MNEAISIRDSSASVGERRLLPPYLLRDRDTLETESRRLSSGIRLADDKLICRILGRYIIYADANDSGITPHLCMDGYWESWITLAIARLIRPGWHCVDVGANHGYYSVLMAAAAGSDGRVLAVEPNRGVSELVEMSLEVNGFSVFSTVACVAAADKDRRKIGLHISRGREMLATIVPELRDPGASVVEVETMTIDTLIRDWPRVDLIKIDAEGAEDLVWSGMSRTLDRNPGVVVLLEYTPSRYRDPAAFLSSIRAAGFSLRHVSHDGDIAQVSREELLRAGAPTEWWMLYLARV